ncbi:MAG TPA: A24 family peptidase [Polyangiaceae bacterium]|nr:A24 family peptidase [Polyangiaceae bacterium]
MLVFLLAAVVVSAIAAICDLRTGRIPNWLTFGTLGLAVAGHFVRGALLGGLGEAGAQAALSLAGAIFCALSPGVLYLKHGMGGGDLKLFAALGALCHPMLGIELELYAFALTVLVVPGKLVYEGRLLRVLGSSYALVRNAFLPASKRRTLPPDAMSWVPLGPAVFGGALVTLALHHAAGALSRLL